ncbi:MAG: DUF4835 domain-containing protein [Flavobacteriaceae bacterium]|nr:DUF4835 domain-containing protein [Flavobacteriaceae bacterium]|tara:strand:+ start:1063 stop:1998 length:936 start_codon:yes stop_codon:yes gene_type:complete
MLLRIFLKKLLKLRNNNISFFISAFFSIQLNAQELKCSVVINSSLVNQTNQQIFKTLENSIREFMNSKVWTSRKWDYNERIECSLIFNITEYNNSNNNFNGTLQIISQRPVYQSNYSSPMINYQDNDINFKYEEYQPLFYNSNIFESNLISILSFYAYVILGVDSDSFSLNGGQRYFSTAQQISNLAQQNNVVGWNPDGSRKNRYWFIDSILSNAFVNFRKTLYEYHRNGLDQMTTDQKLAKQNILNSLKNLDDLNKRRPNSFLIQFFFDSKSKEIVNVMSGGPLVKVNEIKQLLKRIAPFYNESWREIKF